ncbi:MAG: DUF2156 domain-containing protein [Planctomycetaceae bacterium]|nr:DUF2156 domain-containing protein [Planctomycetaceae bacterium]MCB9953702.1 DUF2156 domain-containing protein [Planctomycetaceae bacterium]
MTAPLADIANAATLPGKDAESHWSAAAATPCCRESLNETERQTLETLAFSHGEAPESYDVLISSGSVLMSPCGGAALSVLPHLKYWHMPGGILAPDELKPQVVDWLKEISQQQRKTIAVYNVNPEHMPLFLEAGYEINKLGEEPVLDLGGITWKGKDFEWVRRQTNYCQRAGLEISEFVDEEERVGLAEEMLEVMTEDLSTRSFSHPLRLLEGEFDPHALFRRRLFLARHGGTGRIEGFLACSPMLNGRHWAFETYRKRSDAPRGTIPFLFRTVVDKLQEEGVEQISLCLVPGKGVNHTPVPKAGYWMARWSLNLWYTRLNFLFNAQGQNYFKSRFRPRYVDRFICVTPKSTPISISSFLYVMGGFSPNVPNVMKNLWHSWRSEIPTS